MRWLTMVGLVACAEDPPEIWLDRSPVELGVVAPGEEVDFSLQIANDGGGTLQIDPFALRGDDDCAFWLEGPDVDQLSGSMQGFVQGTFRPTREGLHQVALYLTSNAETLPSLTVPICALVAKGAKPGDVPVCEEPPEDAPNCSP